MSFSSLSYVNGLRTRCVRLNKVVCCCWLLSLGFSCALPTRLRLVTKERRKENWLEIMMQDVKAVYLIKNDV